MAERLLEVQDSAVNEERITEYRAKKQKTAE